jgi:hypothetical protein
MWTGQFGQYNVTTIVTNPDPAAALGFGNDIMATLNGVPSLLDIQQILYGPDGFSAPWGKSPEDPKPMSIKNPTRKLFSLAAVLVATIGTGTPSAHDQVVPIGAYAEIELPPGAVLQKSPEQMPDFSVYYLKNGDKNLLGIYFGNQPDTDQTKLSSTARFGGFVGRVSDEATSNGRNLDAVLALKGPDFPRFVHFFARGLSDQQVAEV